jgi:hypothetical protein
MHVICLEEAAFYALVDRAVDRLNERFSHHDKWVSGDEAMALLCSKKEKTENGSNSGVMFGQIAMAYLFRAMFEASKRY